MALALVAASAVALLLYFPSYRGGFLGDDIFYLHHNPLMELPVGEAAQLMVRHSYFANWAPLHLAVLYAQWAAFGEVALGYRIVNVLLHAATALLLAAAARRAGLSALGAGLAGALFLVHPVAAEPVCWINQSKTLLATALALLSLERWLAHLAAPSRGALAGAWAAGLLALLAKPAAVPLPAILALAAWTHGRAALGRRLLELAPLALAGLAVLALNLAAQSAEGGVVPRFGGSAQATARIAPWLLWRYLRLTLLPFDLVFGVHPAPAQSWAEPRVLLPLCGLVLLAGLAVWGVRRCPRRALGVGWFALMVLPVLQLVPMANLFADRYLYVALPGALALLAEPLARGMRARRAPLRGLAFAATGLALVAFAAATVERARLWSDPEALYREATEAYPLGRSGWTGLGAERHRRGELEGAAAAYLRSLAVYPDDGHVRHLLGRVRMAQGRLGQALYDYQEALRLNPDHIQAREIGVLAARLRSRGMAPLEDRPPPVAGGYAPRSGR